MVINRSHNIPVSRYCLLALCSALLLLLAAPACTCRYVDCEGNEIYSVRFLSSADSSDLFANGALVYDSLRVQALYPDGARAHDHRFTDFFNTDYDVAIELKSDLQGYIFQVNAGSADTLFLQIFRTTDTPCCPGVLVMDQAVFKGDTLQAQGIGELRIFL